MSKSFKMNQVVVLDVYRKYPVLWNTKHRDYNNKALKQEQFTQMYTELLSKGVISGVTEANVKRRIRYMEEMYHKEREEKQNCARRGKSYTPKHAWFHRAGFLKDSLLPRKMKVNSVAGSRGHHNGIPSTSREHSPGPTNSREHSPSSDESNQDYIQPKNNYSMSRNSRSGSSQSLSEVSGSLQRRGSRMSASHGESSRTVFSQEGSSQIEQQGNRLEHTQNVSSDDPIEHFLKYVGSELRRLPQRLALNLQEQIFASVKGFKRKALEDLERPSTSSSDMGLQSINLG